MLKFKLGDKVQYPNGAVKGLVIAIEKTNSQQYLIAREDNTGWGFTVSEIEDERKKVNKLLKVKYKKETMNRIHRDVFGFISSSVH